MATEFGITTIEQLVLRCIPPVANTIRTNLVTKYDPSSIPEGDLSPESKRWFETYLEQQRQQQAAEAASQNTFEVPVLL